jgi:probable phosphoglycerate mutase
MTTLLAVIRHAPTEWNAGGRIQGRSDIPLSPDGRSMVAGKRPPDCLIDAVWRTSPLVRTRETAALLGITNAVVDTRLIEMDWGDWEGETLADLRHRHGQAMRDNEDRGLDFTPPNGESPRQVQRRLRSLLVELAAGPPLTGAVTHKGVIRALHALATGWDMLGKPEVRLDWRAAHVFSIDAGGVVTPRRMNLPLICL